MKTLESVLAELEEERERSAALARRLAEAEMALAEAERARESTVRAAPVVSDSAS